MTSNRAASVLIVEDDEGIGAGLVRAFEDHGYTTTWSRDAASALHQPRTDFDVIVLDLGLPDQDGLDVCRRIRREQVQTPILMLTARGSETDIVVGLDAGADDYLVKPFRLTELLARVRALSRRPVPTGETAGAIAVGDITADPSARRAYLGDTELILRPKEFDLLVLLLHHAGRVVTRRQAMEEVWHHEWEGPTKTLDVHIAALRHKFGELGPNGSRIATLRSVGYRLELPGPEPSE